MRSRSLKILLLSTVVALSACTSPPTQQDTGMVIGGILGGVLGSQVGQGRGKTAATIAGTVIGAAIGGAVGRSMDETDRLKMGHTLETVRTGVASTWQNPDTDSTYTVVPTQTYDTTVGPCREYRIDAIVSGRSEQIYGTACRQPDGSWRVQN